MALKTRKVFDVDYTIRRFYEEFQAEHTNFLTCIQNITVRVDRERYASLMLHRLMVVYFLQKRGFLDHNINYLADKLKMTQERKGKNTFFSFYRLVLLHLFQSQSDWQESSLDELYGALSYLNGNLLSVHELEREYPDVQIPDEAFERLFAFFDSYQWQIDEQPSHDKDAINPEVIGYIFEKYINQKQMGAYYTKDDITEYIGKNTIIPYILCSVQRTCERDFLPDGPLWQLLRTDPDRYISASIRTVDYLPTETEREYADRYKRYTNLKTVLTASTPPAITDLITYNLNLCQLVLDIIHITESTLLLRTFYECLLSISILDPTCGSGAFLFAALNILTPLYTACLERMREMVASNANGNQRYLDDWQMQDIDLFREILRLVDHHPNQTYFILKTITTNNLYGVDIMKEAVEICKLRLFLKLIAQLQNTHEIEELSDINFNIRVGNTLVGAVHTHEIEKGTSNTTPTQHDRTENHQQFHWPLEFRSIMQRGGFDVIIGNPPYVEYSKVRQTYTIQGYETENCGNLYAAVIERSLALCRPGQSFLGCIVPLSICGSERFHQLRHTIMRHTSACWLSNFEIFPCRLFDGAFQRLSILLARHEHTQDKSIFVTKIQRWYASERPYLIDLISYTRTQCTTNPLVIPKLASPLQECILQKVLQQAERQTIASLLSPHCTDHFVYYQEATNYWMKAVCCIPYYKKNGEIMVPPHGRFLYFLDSSTARTIMAIMNSSLFYVWFATYSDGFHLSHTLAKAFPVAAELCRQKDLLQLSLALEQSIKLHARLSTRNTRATNRQTKGPLSIELEEYRMNRSKPLIDVIDTLLAQYYGFTPTELDFIMHYDSKYRMGKEDEETGAL